jgi:hypothetical protein
MSPEEQRIDVHTLSEDFLTDQAGAAVLLERIPRGGLLHPNGGGSVSAHASLSSNARWRAWLRR